MAFCDNCGHELRSTSKFCGSCGTPTELIEDTPKTRRSKPVHSKSSSKQDSDYDAARRRRSWERPSGWKRGSTTLLLAILPGLLGILGVGHLYLGARSRGVGLLIVGLVLLVVGLSAVSAGINCYDFSSGCGGVLLVGTLILIPIIPLLIWQIIDSRKICRQYNDYYEEYGETPW